MQIRIDPVSSGRKFLQMENPFLPTAIHFMQICKTFAAFELVDCIFILQTYLIINRGLNLNPADCILIFYVMYTSLNIL